MKFGVYIKDQVSPEWAEHYLNYDLLKETIKEMEELQLNSVPKDGE